MQELITAYIESDESKEIKDQIIKEIQTCEKVWTAFSPITKNHFVDYVQGRPTAFLFSEKEICQQYCNHMKESGFTVGTAECSLDNRLGLLADYHRSGFECVIVDNGKNYIILELTDLINIPDPETTPKERMPFINPSLICSADRFFQCLENKTITGDKEINLLLDTYNAKFLIPVEGEIEDGNVTIPALERSDGLKVAPFFTDLSEYRKFDSKEKFKAIVTDYTQIESICNNGGTVVINPMGFNFTLEKKTIDAIRNAVNTVPGGGKGNRAVIYMPDRVPKVLIDTLNTIFDGIDGIVSGHVRGLRKDNESQLLIVADCGDSDAETTEAIMNEIREQAKGIDIKEKVEYVAGSTAIGRTAMIEIRPFFERIVVDVSVPPENV